MDGKDQLISTRRGTSHDPQSTTPHHTQVHMLEEQIRGAEVTCTNLTVGMKKRMQVMAMFLLLLLFSAAYSTRSSHVLHNKELQGAIH